MQNQQHQPKQPTKIQSNPTMITQNLKKVLQCIALAKQPTTFTHPIRLVAVSKTKSVQQIRQAYDAGIRHFGQNYVDQIEQKQPKLPLDIKWHFIGHLQSNKIKKVIVPNLEYLQTVDRQSLAEKVQKHLQKQQKQRKLKIFIQVKTSQQQSKSGIQQSQVQSLYLYIKQKCPNLIFKGLMTIGKQADIDAFKTLTGLKKKFVQKYGISQDQFQLSMGMSGDFQKAIQYGATNVRVGSLIFGARNYVKKQKQQKVQKKSVEKHKANSKQKIQQKPLKN